MTEIYRLDKIQEALTNIDLIPCIEEGFIAYSLGKAQVPPVEELLFKDPPGDVHIKF
jgi:ornithine cyclodeaminase